MKKFDYAYLADRTWDNEIMSYVSKIHEYKGKQEKFAAIQLAFWNTITVFLLFSPVPIP